MTLVAEKTLEITWAQFGVQCMLEIAVSIFTQNWDFA